jgi:hypothetical protein
LTSAIEHLHVKANGISFRVAVSGPKDGPVIVCLRGFPEGSMGWRLSSLGRAGLGFGGLALCLQKSLSGATLTPDAKWKLDSFQASVTS